LLHSLGHVSFCGIKTKICYNDGMNTVLLKLRSLLDQPDIEELAAYQHKMPQSIGVEVSYDRQTGYYTAQVTQLDKKRTQSLLITESKNEKELVSMVNDLVLTYLDFPERIKRNMPQLLPTDIDFADGRATRRRQVFAK